MVMVNLTTCCMLHILIQGPYVHTRVSNSWQVQQEIVYDADKALSSLDIEVIEADRTLEAGHRTSLTDALESEKSEYVLYMFSSSRLLSALD
jgi:hypothetical protein